MGDFFQVIVDRDAAEQEAVLLASRIRDWLVDEGIIDSIRQDCVLSSETGYPPGPNFENIIEDRPDELLRQLRTNGLDIIAERHVYNSGQGGFRLVCTECRRRFEPTDEWGEAVADWYYRRGPGILACPYCGMKRAITEWQHDPAWGFGNLGLEFWNWNRLTKAFIDEVSKRLGHRVILVSGKL